MTHESYVVVLLLLPLLLLLLLLLVQLFMEVIALALDPNPSAYLRRTTMESPCFWAPGRGQSRHPPTPRDYRYDDVGRLQGWTDTESGDPEGMTPISIYLSVCLSVCLSVHLSIYLSIYLSICLPFYQSINQSIYRSLCIKIYMYTYVCIYIYIYDICI